MSLRLKALFVTITVLVASSVIAKVPVMVEVDWLKSQLKNKELVIVDMSSSLQYQRYHLANAVYLDYASIVRRLKTGVSLRVSNEKLVKILGSIGIKSDHHVIIYDDMGGFNAGRLFWELERIGHKKVSVLNGGLVSWVLKGYAVNNKKVVRSAVVYRAAPTSQHRDNEIDLSGVLALNLKSGQVNSSLLIDVRSREEYQGSKKYKKSGHIPAAKWWEWDQAVDFADGFKQQKSVVLKQSLAKIGLKNIDKKVVVYCRSGHRAAQTYLTLRNLGFNNIKLYDGSILGYSNSTKVVFNIGMQP